MTLIKVDTSFAALNTDIRANDDGEQYLDANEVKAARAKGCVWLKEGQTYTEKQFSDAKAKHDEEFKQKFIDKLKNMRTLNISPKTILESWNNRTYTPEVRERVEKEQEDYRKKQTQMLNGTGSKINYVL